MFVVHNRIDVPAEQAEGFEQHFAERMRTTLAGVAGLRRSALLKPSEAGKPYLATMEFDSRESFTSWTQSDAFRHAHAGTASEGGPQGGAPGGPPPSVDAYSVVEDVQL